MHIYSRPRALLLDFFTGVCLPEREWFPAGHHFADFGPDHFFPDQKGDEGFAVVDVEGDADHLREDCRGTGRGLRAHGIRGFTQGCYLVQQG